MTEASERTESVTPDQATEATAQERATRTPGPAKVARTYFDAIAACDVDAMVACWAPGGDRKSTRLNSSHSSPSRMPSSA